MASPPDSDRLLESQLEAARTGPAEAAFRREPLTPNRPSPSASSPGPRGPGRVAPQAARRPKGTARGRAGSGRAFLPDAIWQRRPLGHALLTGSHAQQMPTVRQELGPGRGGGTSPQPG